MMAQAAGRGPWGRALLQYLNQNFGLMARTSWNPNAGLSGLGVNTGSPPVPLGASLRDAPTTVRSSLLALGPNPGINTWTGVSQP